jgi:hypothetical protein
LFGVGIDNNIVTASLKAVVSAINRALRQSAEEGECEKDTRRVAGLNG